MPFWGFWSIHWVGKLPGVSCFLLPLNQGHIQPGAFCFPQLKSEMISWVPTLLQITLHYFALAYYNIRHQPKCNGHRSITRSYKSCSAVSSISQMNHISTAFLNCSHQTSLFKCQDKEDLTDEKFRCFYSLTLLASSLAVNGRLKACKRLCCFHFKFIPVLSTFFFFSFTNLPQHGADSCPVPALPTRRKLLFSAFCQQSCLYKHYRTHHTNISGINAEQALTQNCAQQLQPGQHIHLCLERCILQQKRDQQFRATASSLQTAVC